MFIAQFVIFFAFLLLLTLAIVICADHFDYTGNSSNTQETNVEAVWSDAEEDDNEEEDEEENNKSNIVAFSKKTKKLTNSKSKKKSFKNTSHIAPLKMSSSVKNQIVVNDPMLFWKARTTKFNHGMILVDNVAYQNALKEGKAAGLVSPSDSNNHDVTKLLLMKKMSSFKGKSKGGCSSSVRIAQRTMSFTPAPSKNASKVARSKVKSSVKGSKTIRPKSTVGDSFLRKLQVSPSQVLLTLNANKSTKRSAIKSAKSKSKTKSENKSLVTRRSKE